MNSKITAGAQFPDINLPVFGGGETNLARPESTFDWRLVVIYRGVHCPLCTRYLNELETLKGDFNALGVDIVAASADREELVKQHSKQLQVSYPISYDLTIEQMKSLGLYISNPRSEQEADHVFAEPGLFVINDKGQVQVVDISNGPFVRPELGVLLSGLAFVRNPENNYPIRGTYK